MAGNILAFQNEEQRDSYFTQGSHPAVLASGGGVSRAPSEEDFNDAYLPEDESPESVNEFETLFVQLNAMLTDCGLMTLDPRTPFDWMVLFCIATGDIFDFDSRFEEVLSRLFGNDMQSPQP